MGYKYPNIRTQYMAAIDRIPNHIPIEELRLSSEHNFNFYQQRRDEEYRTGLPSFIGIRITPIISSYMISRSVHGKVRNYNYDQPKPIRKHYTYPHGYNPNSNAIPVVEHTKVDGCETFRGFNGLNIRR